MSKNLPQTGPGFEPHVVDILNRQNPRSVVNILPTIVGNAIEKLPAKYLVMNERDARNLFRPTTVMNQIRAAFWLEYNQTQLTNRPKMSVTRVYAGICTEQYFSQVVMKSPELLAWIVLPPQQYEAILNEAWDAGMWRLREILDLPIMGKSGKLDIQAANLVHKVWLSIDQRKNGGTVNKNFNVNVNADAKSGEDISALMRENSMEDLETRLKAVRAKMAKQGVDVQSEPVDVSEVPDQADSE